MPWRCGRPVGVGFLAVPQVASPASSSRRQQQSPALSRSGLRARDALVLEHLPQADALASAAARRLFALVEGEDLIQVAREALVRSACPLQSWRARWALSAPLHHRGPAAHRPRGPLPSSRRGAAADQPDGGVAPRGALGDSSGPEESHCSPAPAAGGASARPVAKARRPAAFWLHEAPAAAAWSGRVKQPAHRSDRSLTHWAPSCAAAEQLAACGWMGPPAAHYAWASRPWWRRRWRATGGLATWKRFRWGSRSGG